MGRGPVYQPSEIKVMKSILNKEEKAKGPLSAWEKAQALNAAGVTNTKGEEFDAAAVTYLQKRYFDNAAYFAFATTEETPFIAEASAVEYQSKSAEEFLFTSILNAGIAQTKKYSLIKTLFSASAQA